MDIPEYLTPHEVSAITRRAVQSLAKDRMTDRGIPFVKLGRRVVYARRDVLAFLEAHRRMSTRAPERAA
ncbi:MAG: DNA-binding protein [Gemmatimonadota bacterium]